MAAMSSTITDTMNLFTAYLKNNPPVRSTHHRSSRNAERRKKRRDRSQTKSKESSVDAPTTNPTTPTGRGPRLKNPHPHMGLTGEDTQPGARTPEEEAQEANAQDTTAEIAQIGTYMAYSKRPFTEEYTKATVAAHLQETPRWSPPETITIVPHKTIHPEMFQEHRLLQTQEMLVEENFIGSDSPP